MLVKLYKLLIIKQKHYFRKIRTQKYYHTDRIYSMIPTFHWQQYSIIQHLLHTLPHHCREHPVNCRLLFWSQLFEHYFGQPRCHHDWCLVPSAWITMLTISDHWQNNSVFAAFSLVSVSWGVCPSFFFKSKENVSESCQQKYLKKICNIENWCEYLMILCLLFPNIYILQYDLQ